MASRYSLADYDAEDERALDPAGPPLPNLFAAADFIAALCAAVGAAAGAAAGIGSATSANASAGASAGAKGESEGGKGKLAWAAMGGFAMMCYGSGRATLDIDVVVETSMRGVWEMVEGQERLIIPNTKLLDGVVKVFVRTGPTYGDAGCSVDRSIEVDLVLPGTKGTPRDIIKHRRLVKVVKPSTSTASSSSASSPATSPAPPPSYYYCLDIPTLTGTKLRNCLGRGLERDVHDVRFLLDKIAGTRTRGVELHELHELHERWNGLLVSEDEVDEFLELEWVRGLADETRARYRDVLCG